MNDNQNQYRNPSEQPAASQGIFSDPSTTDAVPTNSSAPAPAGGDIILQPDTGKKKHKGLIIGLICFFAVLLIGGGAFAAVYFINNQPENIAKSAFNNLLNAKQIEIDGSIDLAVNNGEAFGVKSINVSFDEQAASTANSTTATVNINFTNGAKATAIDFGEVMLEDGTLYLEANGLKDFYDNIFYDTAKDALISQIKANYSQASNNQATTVDCLEVNDETATTSEEYIDCLSTSNANDVTLTPEEEATVDEFVTNILDQVGEIVASIDGQWIEISLKDLANGAIFSPEPIYNTYSTGLPASSTSQNTTTAYDCATDILNHMSNYTPELSDLYSQNPFVTLTAGQNSFYNISLDATNLAGYINAASKTKLATDLTSCLGTTVTEDTDLNITAADLSPMLSYLPQISAKFDGFLDHYLTELKISEQNDYYSVSSDLHFSYPTSLNITAPTDSRPLAEIMSEVSQQIEDLQAAIFAY